jgi:hypothetical protein
MVDEPLGVGKDRLHYKKHLRMWVRHTERDTGGGMKGSTSLYYRATHTLDEPVRRRPRRQEAYDDSFLPRS